MTKFLLVAIVIAVVIFLMRGSRRNASRDRPPPSQSGGDMVRCARCGIHLPREEAVAATERFFCSDDHEREYRDGRGT